MYINIELKETDIIFPIAPNICLYASFSISEGNKKICSHDVIIINRKLANKCKKYLFSNINNPNILLNRTASRKCFPRRSLLSL